MERRDFIKGLTAAAAGGGVVLVASDGALAAPHESQRPYNPESFSLLLGEYPNGLIIEPDGSSVVDFSLIRIEIFVGASNPWEPRDAPTEHWRVDLTYEGPDPDGIITRRPVDYWRGFWGHQNNSDGRLHNIGQFVHRAAKVQNGTHKVTVQIRGLESGQVTNVERSFTVAL